MLYIIVGPLCPAALKCFVFYKAPPSDKHSLLWLANWPRAQARVGNVTVMMLVCVCKQATVVSPSLTHESTHTHTHVMHKTPFEQSIANIKLLTKLKVADSEASDCHSKVRMTSSPRFTKRSSIKCIVITSVLCCAVLLWVILMKCIYFQKVK